MRSATCLAAFLLVATSGTAFAEPMSPEAARDAVSKAVGEIRKQNPSGVLPLVEPVIAALQEQQKEKNAVCADDAAQSLALMVMQAAAAADKLPKDQRRDAVAVDSATTPLALRSNHLRPADRE